MDILERLVGQEMKINQKDWSCPKKQNARNETIIAAYRKHFGHSIPGNKQYWTMCGQCSSPAGNPLMGCEPIQVINEGLIKPEQFIGVELNPDIHKLNVQAMPELCFINDDFYSAMVKSHVDGHFNPGIVNADLPRTPDGGGSYISKILAFLSDATDDVLLIANLILRMKYYTVKDGNYVVKKLNKYPPFRYAMSKGNWTLINQFYEYNGAGQTGSRTYMGSFIFVKGK